MTAGTLPTLSSDERFCEACGAQMYQDEDIPQIGWSCPECGAIDDES